MIMNKVNKVLYLICICALSMSVFIFDYSQPNIAFYSNYSFINKFIMEIFDSIKSFDIAYITIFIFMFYFFYKVYFNGDKINKKYVIISMIISLIIVIFSSYSLTNKLDLLYISFAQVFKTIIFFFGYYFIIYAFIKQFSKIKITKEDLKKKQIN